MFFEAYITNISIRNCIILGLVVIAVIEDHYLLNPSVLAETMQLLVQPSVKGLNLFDTETSLGDRLGETLY